MYKPFATDLGSIVMTALRDVYSEYASSDVSFGIGFTVEMPEIASSDYLMTRSAAPVRSEATVVFEAGMIELVAQAAASRMIDDGHYYDMMSDGCACCGHGEALAEKQLLSDLSDALRTQVESGVTAFTFDALIDAASGLSGLEAADLVESFNAMSESIGKQLPAEFRAEPGGDVAGDASTTGVLTVGGSVSGTRSPGGDTDWYAIELQAGVEYTFIMLRSGDNPHEDPYLNLYGGSDLSSPIAFNDDVDVDADGRLENQNSFLQFTPTTTGTYYIEASGYDTPDRTFISQGDYTIYAEIGDDRPDFTLDEVAFFLTDQFTPRESWDQDVITYWVDDLPVEARTLAIAALDLWAEASGIRFERAAFSAIADLTFSDEAGDDGEAQAFASTAPPIGQPRGTIASARIVISENWDTRGGEPNYDFNSYRFQTYIHEVGHALGLGHSGPYNGISTGPDGTDYNVYNQDAWNYTVMSYFDQGEAGTGTPRLVLGLQMADIIAIQDLYGVNTTTRLGDTVYGFNSTEEGILNFEETFFDNGIRPPSLALYDAGGNDTLDLSGYSANQTISLLDGTFSSVGDNLNTSDPTDPLVNNISIAVGTVIENAVGGSGNDEITGNAADNILSGALGDDFINAGNGADELFGGGGDDTLLGDFAFALGGIEGEVYRAYQAVFDRDPDANGFKAFTTEILLGNLTQLDVIAEFVRSAEFDVLYGTLDNTEFVAQLFSNVLPNNEDAAGQAAFVNALNTGERTRAEVVAELANSAEFISLTQVDGAAFANTIALDPVDFDVFRIYQSVFDRAPDDGGFAAFTGSLRLGLLDLSDIAAEFVGSAEFQATYGNLNNTQFVEQLFDNVLPGNNDQTGQAAYVSALQAGTLTRSDVVLELTNSLEFRLNTVDEAEAFVASYNAALISDTLSGGAGNDVLFGNEGSDSFLFEGNSTGVDTVLDFTVGVDTLVLSGISGFSSFADVQAALTQVGADAVITLSGGNSITLRNVVASELSSSDVSFGGAVSSEKPVLIPVAEATPDVSLLHLDQEEMAVAGDERVDVVSVDLDIFDGTLGFEWMHGAYEQMSLEIFRPDLFS